MTLAFYDANFDDGPGSARDEAEYRDACRQERLDAAFAAVMRGEISHPFWKEDAHEGAIVEAVRRAMTGIGLTEGERWRVVFQAIVREADQYAESVERERA
jgi:hypothetical protein